MHPMADQHRAGRRTRRGPAAPYVSAGGLVPGATETSARRVGRRTYERTLVCTPWLAPGTDLGVVLRELVAPHLRPGDVVAISEKVVVVATGRAIPVSSVTPTRLARMVAHQVRPVGDSRGLSIPEKVQYVIDRIGRAAWWRPWWPVR